VGAADRGEHRGFRALLAGLILTSNRAPVDWYPLFPNPVVTESLLDRLINNSHGAFMNGPSYRPNKSPSRVVPTGKTSGK
jgi:DNA replication protein DnaC